MDGMVPPRAVAQRLGGSVLGLGTLAWLILGGLHGDLPGAGQHDLAAAAQPFWRALHILTIVAIALVAAGLALLGGLLAAPRAAVLGRLGAALVVPAGAVLGVGYAIDGFVLAGLAESSQSATTAVGAWLASVAVVPGAIWLLGVGWLAWRRGAREAQRPTVAVGAEPRR